MPPKKGVTKDIAVAKNTPEDVGATIVVNLAAKGFCVLDEAFDSGLLAGGLKDAAALEQQGLLRRPPELVVDGLLGLTGSARIAEIDCDDVASGVDGLVALDGAIGDIATMIEQEHLFEEIGFSCYQRTQAVLHETSSNPPGSAPPLTEAEASNWIFQFMRGAIMSIVCLGPTSGTLELIPYEDQLEEAAAFTIETAPGTVIFLRSDTMAVRHTAPGPASLLTSFLVKEKDYATKRSMYHLVTPPLKKLQSWATERLDLLKSKEGDFPPDAPREWIQAMNHQCFKGQHMACRGAAVRYPTTWDSDDFQSGALSGADVLTEVPLQRWDHTWNYNPDPNGWELMQTYTKHVAVSDGAELFDNKLFSITPAESKVMDPQQRVVLECGYEAIYNSGMKKGQIMNSLGGMYLGYGSGNSDFGHVDRSTDASGEGSFGATGGSAAITANRFSFCLGMKGASIAIDAEDASALVSVYQGCESLEYKGRFVRNSFACVGGIKLSMAAYYWAMKQAMGLMSATGRCFSFDAGADGFVFGDACVNMCIKTMTEMVDGNIVVKEGERLVGVIAGSSIGSNGAGAKMSAPNGPCEQHLMQMALHHAGLSGYDINAAECYAMGRFLDDAVEVSSSMRIFRQADDCDDPMPMTSFKTNVGNQSYGCGCASLLKAFLSCYRGHMTPNLHCSQLNPHVDGWSDQPIQVVTEAFEFGMNSTYYSVFSKGFGGTNAIALAWGRLGEDHIPPPPKKPESERLVFWPGGGGSLSSAATPKKGYQICGTFTGWEPEPMEAESTGVYAFTVTLSENRWEEFQIWQDGDPKKSLYPHEPKAGKLTQVKGPDAATGGNCWHIEGRSSWTFDVPIAPTRPAIGDGTEGALATTGEWIEVSGLDRGLIGAQYRIRLHVSGKYRMVDWERLSGKTEDADTSELLDNAKALPESKYYVTAEFNGWGTEVMTQAPQDDPNTGLYTFDVQLIRPGGEFQIVRNKDWSQVMYPTAELSGNDDPSDVNGPDEGNDGSTWYLHGRAGDCFRIELSRSRATCLDVKTVSWKLTETKELTEEQNQIAVRTRYAVFGSWDGGKRLRELQWTGSYYRFFIELGGDVKESFQVVEDMDWDRIWHPSKPDANSSVQHEILGPKNDGTSVGLNWVIGKEGFEAAGEVYEVKVIDQPGPRTAFAWSGRKVTSVTWQRVPRGFNLAEFEAIGLVLRKRRGGG
jgi:polyketide synthase-associated protein